MTLLVQSDQGDVVGANGYISVAEFQVYHDQRGNSYAGYTTAQLETAIILATDYLDRRFSFHCRRYAQDQETAWPRAGVVDSDGFYVSGVPREVKEATAEYALRALSAALLPDPTRDVSGRDVQSKSETVGPISESVTYAAGATFHLPEYPAADAILRRAGLVIPMGTVIRA
jgi:hypothetical protein